MPPTRRRLRGEIRKNPPPQPVSVTDGKSSAFACRKKRVAEKAQRGLGTVGLNNTAYGRGGVGGEKRVVSVNQS